MKLTKKQIEALHRIEAHPHKSGAFWRDLGHSPATLAALERFGLIGAPWNPTFSHDTILRRQWAITNRGRAALQEVHE